MKIKEEIESKMDQATALESKARQKGDHSSAEIYNRIYHVLAWVVDQGDDPLEGEE